MKIDSGWFPSKKEQELINNVNSFVYKFYELIHRLIILLQTDFKEPEPYKKLGISINQEILRGYPSFFKHLKKQNLNVKYFSSRFFDFLQDYISKTSLIKKVFENDLNMMDKHPKEVLVFSIREFLEPIVTRFIYKKELELSHFKIVEETILFLERTGDEGKSIAGKIKNFEEALKKDVFFAPSNIWLNLLLTSFTKDQYKEPRDRIPVISMGANKELKNILQANKIITHSSEDNLHLYNQNNSQELGFIPNFDHDLLQLIRDGKNPLQSHMFFKLFQFQIKLFWNQWNQNLQDFRKVSIEGGYKALLKQLGYSISGKNIKQIKMLLNFQAIFRFTLPTSNGGTKQGNLITLTEYENSYGKTGKLEIVAGSMLIPNAIYSTSKADGGTLLIPIFNLPEKMIGSRATWGQQSFLHMLVSEYFTLNSIAFSKHEALLMKPQRWEELAKKSSLAPSIMKKLPEVINLFCCPEQGFLERQGDQYTINNKHAKAKRHLIEQGKLRARRSQAGKKSAAKRKTRKKWL